MKLSKKQSIILFVPLFVLLTILIINPNPFGNSTDAVGDESLFLSSALSSIKKTTLPGWEFSKSGSFYGGVQIYLDTLVLVPAIAIIRLWTSDNLLTQLTVALYTGELLHLLRTLNGIVLLIIISVAVYLHFKNKWPHGFGYKLLLLLALLLGNSLFVGIIHTAKVWGIFIILEIILGLTVVAQEYSLRLKQSPLLKKNTYLAVLFWLTLSIICQNVAGAVALLWIAYALFLKHIEWKDFFIYFKKKILYVLLLAATQISFFYRSLLMFFEPQGTFRLNNLSGSEVVQNPLGNIDWVYRLWKPIQITFTSQPLVIIYLLIIAVALLYTLQQKKNPLSYNKLILIALLHPIFVYILRHIIFGMSAPPRHILSLTIAIIFSIIIIMDWKTLVGKLTLIIALALMLIVSYKSLTLYWNPSSEKYLNIYLSQKFNSSENVFIVDGGAGRLSLPLNSSSLTLLNQEKKEMERYKFLLQHLDKIDSFVKFLPTVVMENKENNIDYFIDMFKKQNKKIWIISVDCNNRCQEKESLERKCLTFNKHACSMKSALPQESTTLFDFFNSKSLGQPFFLRNKN